MEANMNQMIEQIVKEVVRQIGGQPGGCDQPAHAELAKYIDHTVLYAYTTVSYTHLAPFAGGQRAQRRLAVHAGRGGVCAADPAHGVGRPFFRR